MTTGFYLQKFITTQNQILLVNWSAIFGQLFSSFVQKYNFSISFSLVLLQFH